MINVLNENLYTVLQDRFPEDPDAACLILPDGGEVSYGMLHQESARYANLIVSLGVLPGDRVAVQVEKSAAAVFLYLGCLRAGAVFLPMNVGYQRHEIEHFLGDGRPSLFVCRPQSRTLADELAAKACVPHLLELGDDGEGSLAESAAEHQGTFATVPRAGADLAAILYTSGTTGRPKGAMLSHGNLAANALVLHRLWGFRPGDVLLHMLPIFHAHGLFVAIHCALLNGSPMLFEPRFDAARAVSLLPRATVFMGVPTYYVRLLAESGFTRQQCAGVRLFISGSAPLLKETFDEFKVRSGHTILERYGMTEGGMFTSNPYAAERRGGTVGFPLPGTTIRILDDAGMPAKTGEVGNILVKGDQVFVGYWRMPEKTREEFTEERFFKTGDMGRLDNDGYITIIGRSRDLIITGGLNVYPKEIEEMVDGMPGVVETAVIGRPDPDLGEVVTAVVVRQKNGAGDALTETGIINALKGTIAGFKVPKQVYFVDYLPRNTMGKVQKNVLQQKVLSGGWTTPAEPYDEGRIKGQPIIYPERHTMNRPSSHPATWDRQKQNYQARLDRGASLANGREVSADNIVRLLETIIEPGDRVCIEGNNQKQADFLAKSLVKTDPALVRELHLVQSVLALPEHMDLIEQGQVSRIDFSFSGQQAGRLATLVEQGRIKIGAIHTYLELFGRYFVDLTPKVALIAAQAADREGNLYTGANTEDTPAIVEATAFKNGIVIAQVNEVVDKLPRVDIPADWVDYFVKAPTPHYIEPLFTRDPAQITEIQILMAMIAIKGLYAEYGITSLNHGIGFDTAAIELLLPTYAAELGLKGKICTNWALNPHPTMIPAIEAGFVQSVHSFGSEVGMERYIAARPDIFFVGRDGSMRSNRAFSQVAGHYACDLFIGSTLQIDLEGNSSTATKGRISGFGGAPNMGSDARGRRHASPAWLRAGREARPHAAMPRGQKLVAQIVETSREHMQPAFVERLDAWELAESAGMELPPVMIYGEDVTHIITEEGIAHLVRCQTPEEREQAIRGVAGYTQVGLARDRRMVENLRDRGIVQYPQDLGIDKRMATRDLLAARSIKDLVLASGGLYNPPKHFRNW